jgi:hypothetical protein
MKRWWLAIAVIGIVAPAMRVAAQPRPVDLPLSPRFSLALTVYRNCVLDEIDVSPLSNPTKMATRAVGTCTAMRGEVRARLIADILEAHPGYSAALAKSAADSGMKVIDPLITQAARDRAHMMFASALQ